MSKNNKNNKNNKNSKSNNPPNKKRFSVAKGETINDCLERIKAAGYQPIRRTEKPIFAEKQTGVEAVDREIVFDAVLLKTER